MYITGRNWGKNGKSYYENDCVRFDTENKLLQDLISNKCSHTDIARYLQVFIHLITREKTFIDSSTWFNIIVRNLNTTEFRNLAYKYYVIFTFLFAFTTIIIHYVLFASSHHCKVYERCYSFFYVCALSTIYRNVGARPQ